MFDKSSAGAHLLAIRMISYQTSRKSEKVKRENFKLLYVDLGMVRGNNGLVLMFKLNFFFLFHLLLFSSLLFSIKDGPIQNYEERNTLLHLCHAVTSFFTFLLSWLCLPEPRFQFIYLLKLFILYWSRVDYLYWSIVD